MVVAAEAVEVIMEAVVLIIEPALIVVDAIILLTHVFPYMAIHLVINIKKL